MMQQRLFYRLETHTAGDGVVRAADNPSHVLAHLIAGNPLAADWRLPITANQSSTFIAWSGNTVGDDDDLFARHPGNWMATGRTALDALLNRLEPQLSSGNQRLLLRPHARHVLSDAPSTARFLADYHLRPFAIALEPAALLEPNMLAALDEHLPRIFQALAAKAALLLLSDAAIDDAGDSIERVALGDGVIDRELLRQLVREHVPAETPVVLAGDDVPRQRQWLGL